VTAAGASAALLRLLSSAAESRDVQPRGVRPALLAALPGSRTHCLLADCRGEVHRPSPSTCCGGSCSCWLWGAGESLPAYEVCLVEGGEKRGSPGAGCLSLSTTTGARPEPSCSQPAMAASALSGPSTSSGSGGGGEGRGGRLGRGARRRWLGVHRGEPSCPDWLEGRGGGAWPLVGCSEERAKLSPAFGGGLERGLLLSALLAGGACWGALLLSCLPDPCGRSVVGACCRSLGNRQPIQPGSPILAGEAPLCESAVWNSPCSRRHHCTAEQVARAHGGRLHGRERSAMKHGLIPAA
jgi:hypothetical protein